MQLATYARIRKELTTEGAFRVSSLHGALTIAFEFSFFIAGSWLLEQCRPWSVWFWVVETALAISMYRMFVILHECGHQCLFRNRAVNDIIGTLAGPACLVPYLPWKHIHADHHQWVGVIDKDPTQAHLLELQKLGRWQRLMLRVFWKTWLPIPFIKFVFELFWGQPFRELRRGDARRAGLGFVSLLVCVAPHAALIAWFGFGHYAAIMLPRLLLFYMFFEMINLPQHSGHFPFLSRTHPRPIPFREQDEITRTTYLPRLLAVIFCYNFNLHTEHHLFPTMPWYRLPRITEKLRRCDDCQYEEVGFISFMMALRWGDPLDLYEKTLPKEEDITHVEDFPQADCPDDAGRSPRSHHDCVGSL
jgi:fatty acid desaturase